MRNFIITILFFWLAALATPVLSGPGHGNGHSHGPISSEKAKQRAIKKVQQLVSKGKIDASWSKIKSGSVEKKTFSHDPEWVVTFKNSQISDPSKQTLYIFYSLDGHYLAANFTGN